MINALLLRDKRAAAFNVEDRYPFLDKRLVEFCYAIPTEMKFKFGWSRYILRIAMTGILPIENQWRVSKANLNPVYKKNLLMFEKKY
ncbi:MAG: asparagine synthase-related protein [Methanobacterium sp.]